jgi:hypothetical protein
MFIPYSLLIALSPLLFENELHVALCVFDDGGGDGEGVFWDGWVATKGVVAGAQLVYVREGEQVAYADVVEAWEGEDVAWSEEIFSAEEGRDDVLGRLRADERLDWREVSVVDGLLVHED